MKEMKEVKHEVEFLKTIKETMEKLEIIPERMDNIKEEQLSLAEEIRECKEETVQMWSAIDAAEQYSKKNNVLISGIPRKKEENVLELVVTLAAKLGVSIKEHDIEIAHGMPSKKDQTTIIVKLNNRMKKQELTRASKKMELKSDCIGLSPTLPIYCDDHLTIRNKYLLKLAKDLKKEGIIQFAWVRKCTIFIKAEETGPAMIIKEEAQNYE